MSLKSLIHRKHIEQAREIAAALTFCGGFIDAYTFAQRGQTLAAGQTGNIIFFSISVARWNLPGMLTRLLTIISFILGLMVVTFIHKHTQSDYWRIFEMIPIIFVCIIVSFLPRSVPNYYIVPFLAIGLAMQSGAFTKIEGLGYSNAFTSGNLKKSVMAWSKFYFDKNINQHEPAQNYSILVGAFTSGAVCSAVIQRILGVRTLLIAAFLLLIINSFYGYSVHICHKEWEKSLNKDRDKR